MNTSSLLVHLLKDITPTKDIFSGVVLTGKLR